MFRLPIVKFFSRILNRITITVVLVALQVAWLLWAFFSLTTGRVWVNAGLQLLSLLMMLYLVRKDENSAYKIGWIALMGVLPLLGGALYLSFGNKRPAKQLRSKLQAVDEAHKADLVQQPGQTDALDPASRGLSRYVSEYGPYPAWKNSTAKYYPCGEAMYPDLLADLEKAERFIFLEFFIVRTGKMWKGVEDILVRKAAQGVDVRLIYDDFGSLLGLPSDFVVQMERAHIRCIPFNPVVPLVSLVMNHRDHRKIVVVDGNTAYTGGINLADEYINEEERFGYWKDAALRTEGAAVWNFTVMFLDHWNAFRPSEEDYAPFMPQAESLSAQSDGVIQPYGDSPLDEEALAETVYLNIINQAQRYVYIYTPYFAVGETMLEALKAALVEMGSNSAEAVEADAPAASAAPAAEATATSDLNGKRVLVLCQGGGTSGLLANALAKAAKERGINLETAAEAYGNHVDMLPDFDLVVLAPQAASYLADLQKDCERVGNKCVACRGKQYIELSQNGDKSLAFVSEQLSK